MKRWEKKRAKRNRIDRYGNKDALAIVSWNYCESLGHVRRLVQMRPYKRSVVVTIEDCHLCCVAKTISVLPDIAGLTP